jgi:hypothetical protein
MTSAAADLATIGSNVSAAHIAAAARTTAVIPAAADEVSASIAHLFSQHAANYQALAGQAAAFHDQFVHNLTAGAFSYASTEATIASLLPVLPNFPATIAGLFPVLPSLNAGWDVFVSVVSSLPTLLASLPPQQALLFLLALPVSLPLLLLARYIVVHLNFALLLMAYPPSFLPIDWQIALYGTAV